MVLGLLSYRMHMRVSWLALLALSASSCSKPDMGQPAGAVQPQESVLRAAHIAASSEHAPNPGYTFVATNLVDGALNTSWQPASSDHISPKWIRLDFDGEVTVTSVAIANGFQAKDRYGDEFLLNSRIAMARLRFEDSSEVPIRFADNARGYARFVIPKKTTRSLELLVDGTYAGTKWNDLAISEIEITGIAQPVPVMQSQSVEAPGPTADQWWAPPPGERKSIEALAYGFAGIDEKDLGAMFTSDLKPIYGAPSLFEERPPRRVPRDAMEKLIVKLRESSQMDAGFRWLFLKVGSSYEQDRDYQVIRAMQIKEIVRVDESARMRRPPDNAMFYLAEVHRGASFDLFIDGRRSAMGAQLELLFAQGDGAARHVRESGSYRLKAFGLGLRDISGDGIFAMTPQQIAESYRTGEPVPVQLVFRTIPGRNYKPIEYHVPVPVVDEPMLVLQENRWKSWKIPTGTYGIEITSTPNGCWLEWMGDAACDSNIAPHQEYTSVSMHCMIARPTELRLTNPTTWGLGPAEAVRVYIERR